MKKGNTLADLLPASTKKQLIDMKKNYKPVPKINNKRSLADFELDNSKTTKLAATKDSPGLVYEYNKTLDAIVANPVEDPPNIIKENAELRNRITQLEKVIKDSCATLMKEII